VTAASGTLKLFWKRVTCPRVIKELKVTDVSTKYAEAPHPKLAVAGVAPLQEDCNLRCCCCFDGVPGLKIKGESNDPSWVIPSPGIASIGEIAEESPPPAMEKVPLLVPTMPERSGSCRARKNLLPKAVALRGMMTFVLPSAFGTVLRVRAWMGDDWLPVMSDTVTKDESVSVPTPIYELMASKYLKLKELHDREMLFSASITVLVIPSPSIEG